jgi:hypothetical protein
LASVNFTTPQQSAAYRYTITMMFREFFIPECFYRR